ncbi:cation diffusion facilitator family transporter [Methylobacter sp. BBA5.1]|uniref:cation diffusion facilitator family transporter n=1 Tax=Methylobacter sp. BBA5.1 TaxID=1495064 RepID=UPI000559C9CC|nr:cation diffusion facilitator family transporter [Methylobacter sp. BBA5.1]
MSHSNSTTAVFYALAANLGVAIAKTAAAFWTGSGSLLAESIHSFADSGNQILLLIGMKRSQKQPTARHPMGYEREAYVWSMMVAITLFTVGGVFSVYEGWLRYTTPHEVENAGVAFLILLVAAGLEWLSLKGALAALQAEKGERTLWQWFQETHSSELMVVTGEDLAALAGLVIALVMLSLTIITGNTAFDAAGSMLIGLLLIGVAALVGREVHSLIVGESADSIRDSIKDYLEQQPCVVRVLNLWAINHGNSVMVTIKAELTPDMAVADAVREINAMESRIKEIHPRVQWTFFELDNAD